MAKRSARLLMLWAGLIVTVIAIGLVVYFGFLQEKPPRFVQIRQMKDRFRHLHYEAFAQNNLVFNDSRHTHARWFYNTQSPAFGVPPFPADEDGRTEYLINAPNPVSKYQYRYVYEEDAFLISGLTCPNKYEVFDHPTRDTETGTFDEGHRNMGTKMVEHFCKYRNTMYWVNRPGVLKYICILCGHELMNAGPDGKPGNADDLKGPQPNIPAPTYDQDGVQTGPQEEEVEKAIQEANAKFFNDVVKAYGIDLDAEAQRRSTPEKKLSAKDVLKEIIKPALEFEPVWPDWMEIKDGKFYYKDSSEEVPLEQQIPIGYKGVIRYLKVRMIWDESARIHTAESESQIKRFEKLSPPKPDPEKPDTRYLEGTLLWRAAQVWMMEVPWTFLGGNMSYDVSKTIVTEFEQDPHDPVLLRRRDEKLKKDLEEARKKAAAGGEAKPEEKKPEEKKPEEPKPEEKKQ